jgi:hypothetical protein
MQVVQVLNRRFDLLITILIVVGLRAIIRRLVSIHVDDVVPNNEVACDRMITYSCVWVLRPYNADLRTLCLPLCRLSPS